MDHVAPTPPLANARLRKFLIQGVCWNVALFGLIRLAWIDQHVVGALIAFQQRIVEWYAGAPHVQGVVVTADCSGADLMALCTAVTLSYPVTWSRRLVGVASATLLVLTLNVARIATLYRAATPDSLQRLHTLVWPTILVCAILAFILWWMRRAESSPADGRALSLPRLSRPLAVAGAGYAAVVPFAFTSAALRTVGVWTANSGAAVLHAMGSTAHATGDVLSTARGAFQVTPECLFTPVLPLYLAAAWSRSPRWRVRALWLALGIPLFFALGVTRLLVLALPPLIVSRPTFLAHGFYQLVFALVAIVVAAHIAERTRGARAASWRAVTALAVATAAGIGAGGLWRSAIDTLAQLASRLVPATLIPVAAANDVQGALMMMPAFQVALTVGLWFALTGGRRWRSLTVAVGVLAASQLLFLMTAGSIAAHYHVQLHALVYRGWAVLVPLTIAMAWTAGVATRFGDTGYQAFWAEVGDDFPVLTGAASTTLYFENEKRLIGEAVPHLAGRTVLKTDLWDEAKNTRILQWMADQGAQAYGIDISRPIVDQARTAFHTTTLRATQSDVRALPFASDTFDVIYSMGTIEHFDETEATVIELARVLKPGGQLILGVPNRHDPFLRPALVWLLSALGLYGYGFEKSYTRRQLRAMLEAGGLDVSHEKGILFIPGWLRMLDLFCHTRFRPLARVTAALVRPFAWLDARAPSLSSHGYLLASVGTKPAASREATIDGVEYVIDAHGCAPNRLRSRAQLEQLFAEVIAGLSLNAIGAPLWHVFPAPGGITGLTLLAESHLTIHTFPERGLATINLYCCRRSAEWDWQAHLARALQATDVRVRWLRRGGPSIDPLH